MISNIFFYGSCFPPEIFSFIFWEPKITFFIPVKNVRSDVFFIGSKNIPLHFQCENQLTISLPESVMGWYIRRDLSADFGMHRIVALTAVRATI